MAKRCRASALNMAEKCPGYPELALKVGQIDTPATVSGRERHAAIQRYIDDMAQCADAETVCAAMESSHGDAWETEVELDCLGDASVIGHADAVAWCTESGAERAAVIDWKSGLELFLPPIEDDLQLGAYALGVARRHSPITEVLVMRVHLDARTIASMVYDRAALDAMEARIRAVLESGSELAVGAHCDRCLLRHHCPALREHADEVRAALIALDEPSVAITDAASAVRFRMALPRLESLIQQGKDALRDFLDASGGSASDGTTEVYLSRSSRASMSAPLADVAAVVGSEAAAAHAKVASIKDWSDDELAALRDAGLVKSYDVVQVRTRKAK